MKKNIVLFCLLLFQYTINAQVLSLHLVKYEKSINPAFSNEMKKISITFDKNTLIDSPQVFNLLFKIDISDRKSEFSGVSNEKNITGAVSAIARYGVLGGVLASGFSSSKQYSIRNTNGYVILDKPGFDSLIKYSKKIFEIIEELKPLQQFSKTYFFKIDKLELSLEIEKRLETSTYTYGQATAGDIDKTIFLKIDESIFILTIDDFKSIYNEALLTTLALW